MIRTPMHRGDLPVRIAGIAAVAAAGGASLCLRALMLGPPHDPSLLEFVLVLASFTLALGGAVLLLKGGSLFDAPPDAAPRKSIRAFDAPPADGRLALAEMLARRARERRPR